MVRTANQYDVVHDFLKALKTDCMGWFCEQYGIGNLEWQAQTQYELARLLAVFVGDRLIRDRDSLKNPRREDE